MRRDSLPLLDVEQRRIPDLRRLVPLKSADFKSDFLMKYVNQTVGPSWATVRSMLGRRKARVGNQGEVWKNNRRF